MNYFQSFILLLLCISCNTISAQEKFLHTWYTADNNNLPQNTVNSIVKDKYGYIWLSTENGIARYDGQTFDIYNSENIHGLISNRMRFFSGIPEKDSIYLLNETHQFLLINNRKIKNLNKRISEPYKSVKEIIESNHNPVSSLSFTEDSEYIDIQANQNLYIIGNDSIKLYNKQTSTPVEIAYKYPASSQFFTINSSLYLDTKNSKAIAFDSNLRTKPIEYDRKFSSSYFIFTNNVARQSFIYHNKKLYYLKPNNKSIETILVSEDFDIPHNNIISFLYDEFSKKLYLGSANKGLLEVRKVGFNHIVPSLPHTIGTDGVYYALSDIGQNKVLSSTGEIFTSKGYKEITDMAGYSDKYMMVVDNHGDVWTKHSKILYRFKKDSDYKTFDKWKLDVSITAMTKAPDGKIWFGTFSKPNEKGGYLYYIDPKDRYCRPTVYLRVKEAAASISVPNNTTIWTGTWKGLCKYDIKSKKCYKIPDFPNCNVRALYIEPTGEVWACSYGKGFFIYKHNKTTQFPPDKNQYLLTSHCIIEDNNGFFWITTNKGIFQVKKQDLLNYAAKESTGIYYHSYNKNSGFPNNEFNGGCQPCGVYLKNQTIYFPSMEGIVFFNPDNISAIVPKNPLYIDEIIVDDKTLHTCKAVELNRNFERLNFIVNSPYFGESYNENIEFMLEGPVNQQWTVLTEKTISFSTLPPGEYILKTRKLTGFGSKWTYKNVAFSIKPAFWQTTWFQLFALALGIVLVLLIIKLRIKYIRYKNTVLESKVILQTAQLQETILALRKTKDDLSKQIDNHKKLIKSITHDIKSPLKFLSITGRYLYNNIDTNQDSLKENLQSIYTSSFQLYHFVDNFLEYAKETNINNDESTPYSLYQLAEEKKEFFRNIALAQKTYIHNKIPQYFTTTINRHLLSIILHNLIDNATKNTTDGSVIINSVTEKNGLTLSIEDTGKGMTNKELEYYNKILQGNFMQEETSTKGMGLPMVAELVHILEGKINIARTHKGGTNITISFTV